MTAILDRVFEPAAPFTAAEVALVAPIASAVATVRVADERVIRQSMASLAAALPSQDAGADGNRLKLSVYQRLLAGCDERALAHACRRCLEELDWLPTIHQLKERMRGWVSPEALAISKAKAVLRARRLVDDADAPLPDPVDVDRVNAFLRSRGLETRFAPDGSTYQATDDADGEAASAQGEGVLA